MLLYCWTLMGFLNADCHCVQFGKLGPLCESRVLDLRAIPRTDLWTPLNGPTTERVICLPHGTIRGYCRTALLLFSVWMAGTCLALSGISFIVVRNLCWVEYCGDPDLKIHLELHDTSLFYIRPFPCKEEHQEIIDREIKKGVRKCHWCAH